MRPGQGRSSWRLRLLLAPVLALLAGCALGRSRLERALLADRQPGAHDGDLPAHYTVHCPDVLQVQVPVPGWPPGPRRVGPDGRIDLGPAGPVRVDGETAPEIARAVAHDLAVPAGQVR